MIYNLLSRYIFKGITMKYKAIKVTICLVFFAYVGYTLISQQFSLSEKKAQLDAVKEQIVQANAEKEDLVTQSKTVNTDEYIEKVAREELGYAAPDEIVFIDATSK